MLSNKLKDARCFKSKESTDPSSPLMEVLCSPSKCQWCRCIAIDAPYSKCLCICMIVQLYKECGETDVPIIVVKGLFSHPGDVALNEYFILTFFNTIAGLSLTHCYLWGVEFTKWDKLVIWWLFACDWAQNEWWWQIVWESQPDLGSILGQSGTWTIYHTLSPKMSFWIYNRHQK